jgi:hypothetical protein
MILASVQVVYGRQMLAGACCCGRASTLSRAELRGALLQCGCCQALNMGAKDN